MEFEVKIPVPLWEQLMAATEQRAVSVDEIVAEAIRNYLKKE